MKKVINILLIVILETLLVLFIPFIIYMSNRIYITLNGKKNITLEYNKKYIEKGVIVKKGNKTLKKSNYSVEILGDVDTKHVGEYAIIYSVSFENTHKNLIRKIQVVDTKSPEIITNVKKVNKDYCSKKIEEFEYEAIDDYDGNITDNVQMYEKNGKLVLEVSDTSKNKVTKEIDIDYGIIPDNKFYLKGDNTMYVELNSEYNDPGAAYEDGCGNPIDKEIKIVGKVDSKKEGEYIIRYFLDDQVLERKVIVYERQYAPKTIYLTFDDGPGYYTESILNTLDKYGVKATFFVTNQFPDYQYLIGEEYNRGHKIAVHTYSHSYPIVYSSVDSYFNDFNQMNEIIKNYTGSYSKLFRFPGGSSNTISARYAYGVVSQIAARANSLGYIYFDWNLDSSDAAGASSWGIYNNMINRVENCTYCVVLMHDIKGTTAEALDSVLQTFKSRGYTFATLDENAPTAHHTIAN